MFNCICDYAKVVVCQQLPSDVSRTVFELAQKQIQEPVKVKMSYVHAELLTNERVTYLSLLTQMFDKYLDNAYGLTQINSTDILICYYIMNLAFDIRLCAESRELYDSYDMFEKFLLKNKVKDGYIVAMKYILQNQ
jgi:hypothetical protein